MFVFFSLLAASVDGFVSGFMTGAMGIRITLKDMMYSFVIIFLYCAAASHTGILLARTALGGYVNILGIAVMLYLAWTALYEKTDSVKNMGKITAVSFSVAVDAGVACRYLAMCGYSVWRVSSVSALLHSVLMAAARAISTKIIRTGWLKYTRYISASFFIIMAVYKSMQI